MADSTHTPGPWRAGRADMTNLTDRDPEAWGKHVYTDDDRAGTHFTGTKLPLAVAEALGCTVEEAHANAQLIAAAPQLLEALDGVMGFLNCSCSAGGSCALCEPRAAAEVALAAARGGRDVESIASEAGGEA